MLLAAAVPLVFVIALVRRRRVRPGARRRAAVRDRPPRHRSRRCWLRNAIHYGSFSLTSQTGDHLAFWIVPLVTERADGTPYQTTVDRMEARYRQRLAERSSSVQANPFRRSAIEGRAGAAGDGAPAARRRYAKAWLEGMVVNLGCAGAARRPARARAAEAELLQHARGQPVAEGAGLSVRRSRDAISCCSSLGLIAMLPFLALEAIGFVMLARTTAVGRGLRRRRARLFPAAQRAGGDAKIPLADGAGADRAGRDSAGVDGGAGAGRVGERVNRHAYRRRRQARRTYS